MTTVACDGCWMWPATHVSGLPLAFLDQREGVSAVRAEHLVADASKSARLAILDAWIDPKTFGAREFRSFDVKLTRVSPGGSPAEVYAYRAGDDVTVIVATPETWEYVFSGEPEREPWNNTNCQHMRFVLTPEAGGWTLPTKLRKRSQPAARITIRAKRTRDEIVVSVD